MKKKNAALNVTLIRYLLSYLAIPCFLFLSFLGILQLQLKKAYYTDASSQIIQRLDALQDQLDRHLLSIDQMHSQLNNSVSLTLYHYSDSDWDRYQVSQELTKFASCNSIIDSIVYLDTANDTIISSGRCVTYKDSICSIYSTFVDFSPVSFSLDEYIKSDTRILTFISDGANQYLLYFPNTDSKAATKLFYIISVLEITDILKENQIDGITSIALIDPDGNPVLGSNLANLTAVSDKFTAEPGIYKVNKENALCMHSGIRGGYAIAALFSNGPVVKQINDVFHSTYIILFGMGILGMLLAFLCMHTTYSPLRKLTKRIVADPNSKEEYIAQLDKAFNSTISENELLQTRLDKYRLSMQSSILDSIFTDGKQNKQNHLNNIDQFFTADPNTCIFVLRIGSKEHSIPAASITQFLENRLPGKDTCVTLESGEHHVTYMVNYTGTEPHKEAVICQLMTDLHKETDYLCAISASTSSPLEIPALYENAVMASNFWDKKAVVSYHEIVNVSSHGHSPQFAYPYERLEWLTASLKDLDFPTAHQQIADLLDSITLLANRQSQFPDFFIRCILIDILMCLINSMNQMNINFSDYSDLYYETLYYCRSCSYQEKETAIHENLNRLLEIFQSQLHSASIHKAQILKIMEANYVSPDFCIAMMADQFHVSIAYMSYLFKKKINENFIDYLWNLRLQKAKDLLMHSDLSIDSVSLAVGYVNSSSFRRKFKQATGMTPSRYRSAASSINK